MKFNLFFFMFTALGIFSLQGALVDRFGHSYNEIVVATDAADSVKLAAEELQKFSREICKAELKIVNNATQFPVIFVGESPELKKRGVTAEGLPSEGYLIKTGDNYLAIIGRDYKGKPLLDTRNPWRCIDAYNQELKLAAFGDAGTLTGVYEFLRQIGEVRFYLPGELGTVITSVPNLTVPELNVSGAPRTNYRYPWFSMFERSPQSALWARRVGFGGKAPVMIIDSYTRFQKYRDSHPEYFALADGKRAFGAECAADGHGHLCLTNPAVIKQWANDIIEYFENNPQVDVYPLTPSDGLRRICECKDCQAELRQNAGNDGRFSYHIWNFTGKVAALVGKRFPNKYVGCLAYERYHTPPAEIGYMPNVAVMFCNWRSFLANPAESAKFHAEVEAWSAKVDRVYLWTWYLDHWLPWNGLPVIFTDTIERELKYMFKNPKYSGEFIESEGQNGDHNQMPTPGMQHLNLYVTARLYWNPQLKVATLIEEYCKLFYGPAAAPMQSFWLTAQQRRSAIITKNLHCSPDDVFTPVFITKLNDLLKQALDATPAASVYRERVELIRKEFSAGSKRLTRLEKIGIQKLEIPLVMNMEEPFTKIKPVKFVGKNGEDYTPSTWLYAGYDRQYLYLKFVCFEPIMAKLRREVTSSDGETWTDDSIEVFICPDESKRDKCYQLVINSNNALFDAKVLSVAGRDPKWNSKARIKTKREENRWIVEISLPFASIDINDPNFTGELAANFYRNRSVGAETTRSCWSPTGAFAHYTPDKFGVLKLRK
jgi:hypothetical protein